MVTRTLIWTDSRGEERKSRVHAVFEVGNTRYVVIDAERGLYDVSPPFEVKAVSRSHTHDDLSATFFI